MDDAAPTWIVLARDVSESIAIRGQRRAVVAVVLDVDTGLIVQVQNGTSFESVLPRVLKGALVRPSAPLAKAVPGRVVVPPELLQAVGAAAAGLTKLAATAIVEGHNMHDAEEILDGLVGHLEGREQPEDLPTVEDWQSLYRELAAYTDAAPWKRWCDNDWFHARFELDGASLERDCLILGHAGVQHGFNVLPDAHDLLLAGSSSSDQGRWGHLDDAVIVHLDPWRETNALFADKARRYNWPSDARLVPSLFTVRMGSPADLGSFDARLLALALRGVLGQESRRLIAVGQPRVVKGEMTFADGSVGTFEVDRP